MPLDQYERHITEECEQRVITCPNKCASPPLHAQDLDSHLDVCPMQLVLCNACQLIKVPRQDSLKHLRNECPKGQQECQKCHGIYKTSSEEEHCCISHLYRLIQEGK